MFMYIVIPVDMLTVVFFMNGLFTFAICRHPSVCLSVTFVRPAQAIESFRKCFYAVWYLSHPLYQTQFYGDRLSGTPSSGVKRKRGSQI